MDVKTYLKTLAESDWDTAEQIEAEAHATAVEGLTEEVAVLFVQTVFAVRGVVPDARVSNIYDMALKLGLPCVAASVLPKTEAKPKKRAAGVRGV
jgi:hypothetical protein